MRHLSERMREAAQTIEEVSELYGYSDPKFGSWSAFSLRLEADHVEEDM
jgi:hypothetical protein